MSWTWNEEADAQDTDDEFRDPLLDDEEDELADDQPAPEIQSAIQAAVAKAIEERDRKVSESLRRYGLDIGREGETVINDPARLAQVVGPLATASLPSAAVQPLATPTDTGDEMPNFYEDPEGHRKWMQSTIDKAVADATRSIAERTERSTQWTMEREAAAASHSVKQLLPEPLKYLGDQPGFDEQFQAMLLTVPVDQWRDTKNLVKIASTLVTEFPAPTPTEKPRDAQGRFSHQKLNAELHQQSLETGGPSRDGGRTPAGRREPTQQEVDIARRLGLGSIAELRALEMNAEGVCDGEAYLAAKRKRLATAGKR